MKHLLFIVFALGSLQIAFSASQTIVVPHDQLSVEELIAQKKFDQLIDSLEVFIQKQPHNSIAYYNLGNAYFYKNQIGRAVWAYESALKYDPLNKDAEYNCEMCYRKLRKPHAWSSSLSTIEKAVYGKGVSFWGIVLLLLSFNAAICIYFFLKVKKAQSKRILFLSLSIIVICAIGASVAYFSSKNHFDKTHYVIITNNALSVYEQENLNSKIDFQLEEGDRLVYLDENLVAYKVELPGRGVFYIEKNGAAKVN